MSIHVVTGPWAGGFWSADLFIPGAEALDFSEAGRAVGDVVDRRVVDGDLAGMEGEGFQNVCARTAFTVGIGEAVQTGSAQQFQNFFVGQARSSPGCLFRLGRCGSRR